MLATLNNAALALMDLLGVKRVPDQMRLFDAQPHLAVFLLMERGMIALGL
ncbi:hypothetical protein KSF_027300 [Reticulibacter mediterranei]|uniref:Uncharacterized protein n=1 Tax=Reticulibacter mediterranei TaxID=2778369 RepID=A0A8J3IJY9_9CHLR|nr:hypothetical protein KSF_027300 [Reticulibacter mediterranei]